VGGRGEGGLCTSVESVVTIGRRGATERQKANLGDDCRGVGVSESLSNPAAPKLTLRQQLVHDPSRVIVVLPKAVGKCDELGLKRDEYPESSLLVERPRAARKVDQRVEVDVDVILASIDSIRDSIFVGIVQDLCATDVPSQLRRSLLSAPAPNTPR
jgi:hypothetical protein